MWRAAIMKEWNDMKKRNVWIVQKRCDMPTDRRCVKSKWVFKLKRNGVFRARIMVVAMLMVAEIPAKAEMYLR
eukprot:scaffold3721_cov118-Alexandrium_tamarense.AAC.3